MAIVELDISGYRSLRRVVLRPGPLNVVTGPNGSGKSNLYRSLWLLHRISEGTFLSAVAEEGGLPSVLWAGERRKNEKKRVTLGFRTEDFGYRVSLGYMTASRYPIFPGDPEVKEEKVWFGEKPTPSKLLVDRTSENVFVRDPDGKKVLYPQPIREGESILAQLRDPDRFPELYVLRDQMRSWRFYHNFRTGDDSPLRRRQVGCLSPVLSHDGANLAACLRTIEASNHCPSASAAIAKAFPGRSLSVVTDEDGREFEVGMGVDGLQRGLTARELSDGTLKYFCLVAALLSPEPPPLLALNEPEASLHPDLVTPLAELIVSASFRSEVWVCTHSAELVRAIESLSETLAIRLSITGGETQVERPE